MIEAVFEEWREGEVFTKLDEVMKPGAILPPTPTLDLNNIASFTRPPQDVIGTHFSARPT